MKGARFSSLYTYVLRQLSLKALMIDQFTWTCFEIILWFPAKIKGVWNYEKHCISLVFCKFFTMATNVSKLFQLKPLHRWKNYFCAKYKLKARELIFICNILDVLSIWPSALLQILIMFCISSQICHPAINHQLCLLLVYIR